MNLKTILEHMNRDHKVSLYDYLAYYGNVKLNIDDPKDSVELINIELDKLTLNYSKNGVFKSVVIPLDPPMSSVGDSRRRFIAMAFEAARGQNLSPYRIKDYKQPTGSLRVSFVALLAIVASLGSVTFSKRVANKVLGPRGPSLRAVKSIFWATILTHIVEYATYVVPLLRFYRVPARARLQYLLATLSVGFPGWLPLRNEARVLAQRQADQEKSN